MLYRKGPFYMRGRLHIISSFTMPGKHGHFIWRKWHIRPKYFNMEEAFRRPEYVT